MKTELMIACLSYWVWGIAMTFQLLGRQAGISFAARMVIFIIGLCAFLFAAFISLPELKNFIKKHEIPQQ